MEPFTNIKYLGNIFTKILKCLNLSCLSGRINKQANKQNNKQDIMITINEPLKQNYLNIMIYKRNHHNTNKKDVHVLHTNSADRE